MIIDYANELDFPYIFDNDKHLAKHLIKSKIRDKQIIIAKGSDNKSTRWLRYEHYWDNIPFMNMLFIADGHRKNGVKIQLNVSRVVKWKVKVLEW